MNWFYYYKWWVLIWCVVIWFAGSTILEAVTQVKPDYRFACVTESPLPEDTLAALERAIASLGEDLNGDGRVVVAFHSYPSLDHAFGLTEAFAQMKESKTGME